MKLSVRVTRPAKAGSRVIPCWPVDAEGTKQMKSDFIGSLAFDGDPAIFTVGTVVSGECVVRKGEELKSYAPGTRELVPRFALDADGLPIVGEDGQDAVLCQGWIKWQSGTYDRALPSEEALKPLKG